MLVQLPIALKQSDGTLTKEVEIEEMTGTEEDILSDQTRAPGGKGVLAVPVSLRMSRILSRCTVRVGKDVRPAGKTRKHLPDFFLNHWQKATLIDRGYTTVRLRQLSLGDAYTFSDNCPSCKKVIPEITIMLNELEVSEIPLEKISDTYSFTTKNGRTILWRMLRSDPDDVKLEEILERRKADLPTALIQLRVVSIDGAKPSPEELQEMGTLDRQNLLADFDDVECGIDTDIQIVCDSCDSEFWRKLPVGKASFFFPSGTRSASKGTSRRSQRSGAPTLKGDGSSPVGGGEGSSSLSRV